MATISWCHRWCSDTKLIFQYHQPFRSVAVDRKGKIIKKFQQNSNKYSCNQTIKLTELSKLTRVQLRSTEISFLLNIFTILSLKADCLLSK